MHFTAEELAEMSRADAEIEASFRWTQEEIALSRELDKAALLEVKDAKSRHRAEAQRRWYEANKEKVSEGKRRYREANKEKVSEGKRRYREANKEKVLEAQRRWYEANKEKVLEAQRRWYEANKEKVLEAQRRWYEANKEKVLEAQRRYREANKEKVSEGKRELREFRRALDMTQAQFALLAGVSQPTICIWETIAAPKNWSEIIEKIRSRYHVETEYAL